MSNSTGWQPTASLQTLQTRARLLQQVRAFFSAREVLEVETPNLSQAGTIDPHIESFRVKKAWQEKEGYLHTSPEFAMKRLLAAGFGDIYQLSKVFRQGEAGAKHNPEFSLLEWYRLDLDMFQLMAEVDALVRELLTSFLQLNETQSFTYQHLFQTYLSIDPLQDSTGSIVSKASEHGFAEIVGLDENDRDAWLDLLISQVIEPRLAEDHPDAPVFIYHYPASQAALAKVSKDDPRVAERFELFINGMELANGFHELSDSVEQRQRFEQDNLQRQKNQQATVTIDESFIHALENGNFPDCSGVAIGFDRLVMLAVGAKHIEQVLTFPFDRA